MINPVTNRAMRVGGKTHKRWQRSQGHSADTGFGASAPPDGLEIKLDALPGAYTTHERMKTPYEKPPKGFVHRSQSAERVPMVMHQQQEIKDMDMTGEDELTTQHDNLLYTPANRQGSALNEVDHVLNLYGEEMLDMYNNPHVDFLDYLSSLLRHYVQDQ